MTKDTALHLISEYSTSLAPTKDPILTEMPSRWPEGGSEKKAMRWLGFLQGAAYTTGTFTLEELKEHSRRGHIHG